MRFCSICGTRLPHPAPVTCPACNTIHYRNSIPTAGALVTHEGKLLLVRRSFEPWKDCWDIPGGFCEPDEHPQHTAAREAWEETGIRVRITGFLSIWMDSYGYASRPDEELPSTMNVYYHAVPLGAVEARPDATEVSEIGWFAPDALPDVIAFPAHELLVLRAWREVFLAGQTEAPLPDRG